MSNSIKQLYDKQYVETISKVVDDAIFLFKQLSLSLRYGVTEDTINYINHISLIEYATLAPEKKLLTKKQFQEAKSIHKTCVQIRKAVKKDDINKIVLYCETTRKEILHNKVECNVCHTIIESKHQHDFVTCVCGETSVDGGKAYTKRCYGRMGFTDLTEYEIITK
jgi:hypothetical protein